jgi:hypothetical protein
MQEEHHPKLRRRSIGPALSTVPEEASVISKGESQSEMPNMAPMTSIRDWLSAGYAASVLAAESC